MEVNKKINWGISRDLQADIRYEYNACKGYVIDLSLGCSHKCSYCIFSPLELKVYKLHNPDYNGEVLTLKLEKFLERKEVPPSVYMCYSSDPLGNEDVKESSKIVLKKLLENNVNVLFITKGIFDDSILDIVKERPDLMNIQIDVSNYDNFRNNKIEPGAPSYTQRVNNIEKLTKIEGLGSLAVRMDPLLPNIDDTNENVEKILKDISILGVNEVVVGYVVLTENIKNKWSNDKYTKQVTELLTEKTPTISQQALYSIPFEDKVKRIEKIHELCKKYDIKLSVCGCKDERFKKTDFEWVCHPFNREVREKLNKQTSNNMVMDTDHLT